MLTFFRKIRRWLLAENNFSKYLIYAIGEIILVVIGILIALSINNWNENRKESNYEQKILKELKADFSYNDRELNGNIIELSVLADNCDSLLALFNLPENEVHPDKFLNYMSKLGGYSTFNPSDGSLNSLIGSGNLNIIKNDSLRLHLARWSGILEDVKEDEKRLIDFGDQMMLPIRLEHSNPKSESARVSPALLENLKVENIVRTIRGRAEYIIENYHMLGVEITVILDEISRELKVE